MTKRFVSGPLAFLVAASVATSAFAGDWPQFRGPNGSGVSADKKAPPSEWDGKKNIKWKIELPGPGLSSPIVVGDKIFVTCWTGYAIGRRGGGEMKDLRRNLLCIDRKNGKILWNKSAEPVLPEDSYRGMFAENGYASHTPASDGKNIYVFYGKTGVLAYDLTGKKLWQTNVGKERDPRGWGSAASPILHKDKVIVPASAESEALVALDKKTGKQVWKKEARGFGSNWGTPVLVKNKGGETELVMALPGEIWGFNPDSGKFLWYCTSPAAQSTSASPVVNGDVVYYVGGRYGGSIAVRAGGKKDATESNVVWKGRASARISSPIYYDGRIYWINRKTVNCIDAKTGKEIFRGRLSGGAGGGGRPGGGRPGGRPGGGFGRGGGQDYGSPVLAGGKIFYFSRSGTGYVIEAGKEFKQLADNSFGGDIGEISSSPAISNGELFVRSSKMLFCIAKSED